MPSSRVPPLSIVCRRPGRAPFRAVSLDDLTNIVRISRQRMASRKEELKALRLKAMSVVGSKQDAIAGMYSRVIEHGAVVDKHISAAEDANIGAMNAQIADMKEMIDELSEFEQAANPTTGTVGATVSPPATAKPSTGSDALAKLMAAEPGRLDASQWTDGNAYHETHPEPPKS